MEGFEGVDYIKPVGIVMAGKMKAKDIEEIGDNGKMKKLNFNARIEGVSVLPKYIEDLKEEQNVEISIRWGKPSELQSYLEGK